MSATSLSRDLWDPSRVLDVNPNDPHFTCVGLTLSTGSRCRFTFYSERFKSDQGPTAIKILESMSKMHPSEISRAALYSLAQSTLCEFHLRQADDWSTKWNAEIEDYLNKETLQETGPASKRVTAELKALKTGWSEPTLHRHSGDHDVHHGPFLRAHSASSPAVMVSSLQFERHVAGHFEQLALFALPLPIRESSRTSSNQAAASRHSDRKTGLDATPDVFCQSSAHTDTEKITELYAAVMRGNVERVTQELRSGADLTLQYGIYGNLLQAAAVCLSWPSRDEILRVLLDSGADVNMQGGVYGNALQAVAANPGVSGRRLLALHQAIRHGDDESVQLLLDRGASTTIHHEDYGTPVEHARRLAYEPVWQLLQKAAPKTSHERHYIKQILTA